MAKVWQTEKQRADRAELRVTQLNDALNRLKYSSEATIAKLEVQIQTLTAAKSNLELIITQRNERAEALLTKLKDTLFDVIKEL